jgi:hypothetical protein
MALLLLFLLLWSVLLPSSALMSSLLSLRFNMSSSIHTQSIVLHSCLHVLMSSIHRPPYRLFLFHLVMCCVCPVCRSAMDPLLLFLFLYWIDTLLLCLYSCLPADPRRVEMVPTSFIYLVCCSSERSTSATEVAPVPSSFTAGSKPC